MKRALPLAAALLFMPVLAVLSGADITLRDARVLRDARIVSQTPRNVTVRHAGGLSSVAKTLLPAELQAKYPVDEAAAQAADDKARLAREAALSQASRAKESDASQGPAQAGSESTNPMAEERSKVLGLVYAAANTKYAELNKSNFKGIEIDEVTEPASLGGSWTVTGRARYVYYPQTFDQYVRQTPKDDRTAKQVRKDYASTGVSRFYKFRSRCIANDHSAMIEELTRW